MSNSERASAQAAINERLLSSHNLRESLGARTIAGGAIAVAAQFVRFVLQIGGAAILARLLSPSDFGIVAMGGTVTALIAVLTELNVATAAIQRQDLDQNMASTLMILGLGVGCMAFLLSAAAIPFASWFFKDPRLPAIVLGLGAALPIYSLSALPSALLIRNMNWVALQIGTLGSLAIGIVVGIIAAWLFNAGYWALVIQSWATALSAAVIYWLICPWRPSWVRDWSGAASALKFGFHITASQVLNYFHQQLDNILIAMRWGSIELGFYSRAYNLLMTPLNFLSGPLGSTMVPALSRLNQEPEKWREAYLDALGVITFAGAAMACLLYGGAAPIIDVVLGPHWHPVKLMFSYLVLGMLASTPMSSTSWIYISTGHTNRMFYWSLIGVPIYVASFVIGLPYGGVGVALCYSISRYVAFFPSFLMATHQTNVTISDILAVIAAPTIAAAAIGFGLSLMVAHLDPVPALAVVAAAGVLYAGVCVVAVLRLPVYDRLRRRGLRLFNNAAARFLPRASVGQ